MLTLHCLNFWLVTLGFTGICHRAVEELLVLTDLTFAIALAFAGVEVVFEVIESWGAEFLEVFELITSIIGKTCLFVKFFQFIGLILFKNTVLAVFAEKPVL